MKGFSIILCSFLICASLNLLISVSASRKTGRIVGGEKAFAGQFPFAAAIYIQTSDGTYFCGGALWKTQWIITAAQCVDGANLFTIHLGSNLLQGTDQNRVTVATSEYIIHPDYNADTFENDIALIKLRLPVTLNDYVKSIDLLPMFPLFNYTEVTGIGWGQVNDDTAGISNDLNYVPLASLSNAECKISYGDVIVDDMVCVEGNYNEGTCGGDTGSPLVQYYSRGITMHAGVASFINGLGCEAPYPSAYTRTFSYNQWIRETTI